MSTPTNNERLSGIIRRTTWALKRECFRNLPGLLLLGVRNIGAVWSFQIHCHYSGYVEWWQWPGVLFRFPFRDSFAMLSVIPGMRGETARLHEMRLEQLQKKLKSLCGGSHPKQRPEWLSSPLARRLQAIGFARVFKDEFELEIDGLDIDTISCQGCIICALRRFADHCRSFGSHASILPMNLILVTYAFEVHTRMPSEIRTSAYMGYRPAKRSRSIGEGRLSGVIRRRREQAEMKVERADMRYKLEERFSRLLRVRDLNEILAEDMFNKALILAKRDDDEYNMPSHRRRGEYNRCAARLQENRAAFLESRRYSDSSEPSSKS
jgi:hypothetical protein